MAVSAGVSAKRHVTLGMRQTSQMLHGPEAWARGCLSPAARGRVAAAQAIGKGRFGFGIATPFIAILQSIARSGVLAAEIPVSVIYFTLVRVFSG